MFTSKYANLLTLAIGLVIGFYLARMFVHHTGAPAPVASITQPEVTKAKVAIATATYNTAFDSLSKVNATLTTSLATTKSALATAKTQSVGLQRQVLALLDSNVFIASATSTDTCQCDSLRKTVSAFVIETDHKDSLYETALTQSDSLLQVHEQALQVTVRQKDFLAMQLDTALSKQSALIREDLYYQGKFHQQKKKTLAAAAGAAILTAIGILLVHH